MFYTKNFSFFLVIILTTLYNYAYAGSNCGEQIQEVKTAISAIQAGKEISNFLENSDNKVVLIARVGQNLSEYNLKYSHLAFAYKNENNTWEVFHELNTCGLPISNLYKEGLAQFFMDDMYKYDSKIFIPSKLIQEKLYDTLIHKVQVVKDLHEEKYNMLAFPFSTAYQNSNQWILEVVSTAFNSEITSRVQAQNWLLAEGYSPTILHIGTFKRLGARVFRQNIEFNDQPFAERMKGNIRTVTVDSVYDFLEKEDIKGEFKEFHQ